MKFFCLYLFLLPVVCFSQEVMIGDSIHQQPVEPEKTARPPALTAEKLAWEMMLPFGYKKPEKSTELKLFEEIFLQMKTGVGELSLVVGEFNLRPKERLLKPAGKK